MLCSKDVRVAGLYTSPFFFFMTLKMNKAEGLTGGKECLLLPLTRYSVHKCCTRFACPTLFSCFFKL